MPSRKHIAKKNTTKKKTDISEILESMRDDQQQLDRKVAELTERAHKTQRKRIKKR